MTSTAMTSTAELCEMSRLRPRQAAWMLAYFRDELARCHGRARRAVRRSGEEFDLLDWARQYLPRHFTLPPSRMHRWLAEQLGLMRACRGMKLNVLGPRGGAKSTLGTLAYPLCAAVHRWEPYIWIVSDTKDQARAHLENIRAELTDNPRLATDYPQAAGPGPRWRSNLLVLPNGVRIEAFGTGQAIRGRRYHEHRPTLVICDDLQNDGHMLSAARRERSRLWFEGTLLKAGTPRTNLLNLATALHHDALAMVLCRQAGWNSRVFRAVERWPDNVSLWQQWEAIYADASNPAARREAQRFYQRHRLEMEAGAILLWPEAEDLYTLMCMRVEGGASAFAREKQNSPINPDLCEWPDEYFDETIWFTDWPSGLVVKALALDPSKGSDSRRNDFSALVMLGMDRQGLLYVEADLARRPTPSMVADAVQWHERFQPDVFGVETNQFQELLSGELEAEFRRQGLLAARPWPLDNRVNKQVRIRRLGPYLASRRFRFRSHSPGTRLLVEQLRQFPLADHDDGPDALEMALRLAAEWLHGRRWNDGLGQRLPVG
jgi:predicted phage terminase large subunit-like protein